MPVDQARHGIRALTVAGKRIPCKGAVTCRPGGYKSEPVDGADGYHGTTEKYESGQIEGSATFFAEFDVQADLFDTRNVTVVVEFLNGKAFALANANYSGDRTVSTEEGEIPIRFSGPKGEFL